MSATYTIPWASARDYARFQVGDTNVAAPIFQDEEYDGSIAQWSGDARLAAASMLETLAGLYARNAISWSVPGMTLNRTQTHAALLAAAKAIREAALQEPFELESVIDEMIDTAGLDWSNYANTPVGGTWPWLLP